jgi:hypothetical protein
VVEVAAIAPALAFVGVTVATLALLRGLSNSSISSASRWRRGLTTIRVRKINRTFDLT